MQHSARYGFLCGCQACSVEDLEEQEDLEGLENMEGLKTLKQLWEEHVASQDTVWRREGSVLMPAAWAAKGSSASSHISHG